MCYNRNVLTDTSGVVTFSLKHAINISANGEDNNYCYVNHNLTYLPQRHRGHKVFLFVFLMALWENLLRHNKFNLTRQ